LNKNRNRNWVIGFGIALGVHSRSDPSVCRHGQAPPTSSSTTSDDGQISREDKFLAWYLSVGLTYLEKPHFDSKTLVVPTMQERRELFLEFDDDQSGEIGTDEARAALKQLWPKIEEIEVDRGFLMADEDDSGELSELEFKMLVGFIMYFNTQVRKMPSWPISWANFKLVSLYPRRNAWATLHLLWANPTPFSLAAPRAGGARGQLRRGRRRGRRARQVRKKLGQLQPFIAVFPQECMGRLASPGPT
jgi:hypothetical protein